MTTIPIIPSVPRTQLSDIERLRPYKAVLIYDTNYLLGSDTYMTFVELVANLQEYCHVIPDAVHRELEKFKNKYPGWHKLHKQSRKALKHIQSQMQEELLILQTPEDYNDTEKAKREKNMDSLILECAHYIWERHTRNIWLMTNDNGLRNRAQSFNICVQTSKMTKPDAAKEVIEGKLKTRAIGEGRRKQTETRAKNEERSGMPEGGYDDAGGNRGVSLAKIGLAAVAMTALTAGLFYLSKCAAVYGAAKMGGKLLATSAVSVAVVARAAEDKEERNKPESFDFE